MKDPVADPIVGPVVVRLGHPTRLLPMAKEDELTALKLRPQVDIQCDLRVVKVLRQMLILAQAIGDDKALVMVMESLLKQPCVLDHLHSARNTLANQPPRTVT